MKHLTSRERVVRALAFEEPDRVPLMDNLLPGFAARYRESRGLPASASLEEHFGFDIQTVSCSFTPSVGRSRVIRREGETEIFVDRWGLVVRRWVGREGVPQFIRSPVVNEEDLEDYFQDPDSESRYAGLDGSVARIHDGDLAAFFTMSDHWGGLYHIFGLKPLLRLIHARPGLIRKTIGYLRKHYDRIIRNVLDHDVDGVWVFGDLAGNAGPFISPDRYRSLFLEPHRSLFRPVRRRDIPVVFHSDGDIRLLIPQMIEEGVTALQPLDALAGMDAIELKEEYGDRLAFMGNIPNKTVLPRGTPAEVASEVKRKLVAGEGGGYILGSSHSVAADVPPENFEAMVAAARRYGRYP